MFFWLFHALTSFQDYINKILAKKLDIFIYTKNSGQVHISAIPSFFKKLQKYNFLLIWKNVNFIKMKPKS